jgi:hypothetical protein
MVLDGNSPQAGGDEMPEKYNPVDPNSPYAALYPLQISPEHVRRPNFLVLYTGFAGKWNWERTVSRSIVSNVLRTRELLRRNPTQDEVDALAEIVSRDVNLKRVGLPVGMTAAATHTYYVAKRQYPLSPDLPFHRALLSFFGGPGRPELSQFIVGTAWRFFWWTSLGFVISTTMSSYRKVFSIAVDQRLQEVRDAIRVNAEARQSMLEAMKERARQRSGQTQSGGQPVTASAEEPREVGPYGGGSQTTASDAAYDRNDTFDGGDSGEQKEQIPRPWGRPIPRGPGQARPDRAIPEENDNGGDFFDDASPTAPEYQTASSRSTATSGNAWDRIRQQNARGSTSNSQSSTSNPWESRQNSARANDSYTNEEQQRHAEREQAQREFNRMLDSERRTSEENSPTEKSSQGGWKRW